MARRVAALFGLSCFAAVSIADGAPYDELGTTDTGAPFTQSFAFIEGEALSRFRSGADLFRLPWSSEQTGGQARFGGLGPLSNRFSCLACHIGNGRGEVPANESDVLRSMLVRLSVPGVGSHGAPPPEPVYGDQLQPIGTSAVLGEGEASIRWRELDEMLPDGTIVSLRRPELVLSRLHYGPVSPGAMTSIRMSPAIFGLGLLAAVPDEELLALADPEDRNGDGVRGRPNLVWAAENQRMEIGRFGLKANQPNLRQQVAAALIGDMGITSRLFAEENCTPAEDVCSRAAPSGKPDIADYDFATLVSYVAGIAPPARRGRDETSVRGEALFRQMECASCHVPSLKTGAGAAFPQIANRTINPYTDLLLHDMGEGLSDGRPDHAASPRDWRTAPLWGIGLAGAVIERPTYLHDGRARNLTEAILWHGGEAAPARDAFAALPEKDRSAVLAFLNSL